MRMGAWSLIRYLCFLRDAIWRGRVCQILLLDGFNSRRLAGIRVIRRRVPPFGDGLRRLLAR